MSRPDIADYLGLTIESNLVNTEISGSYAAIEARSWRRIVLRNCSALNILRAALTRASAKPERITTHADSNGRSISPLRAQRTKWSIRTPASGGDNAWSAAEFLRHGNKNP
jgi:hypothetical protein